MAEVDHRALDNVVQWLVEDGLISSDQLAVAQETKKNLGGDLGNILIKKRFVTEEQLLEFLQRRLNFTRISLASHLIDPDVIKLVPLSVAQKYHFMPLSAEENVITIAIANPIDVFKLDTIRNVLNYYVKPVLSSAEEIEQSIVKSYRATKSARGDKVDVEVLQYGAETTMDSSDKLQEIASGAKVVAEVNRIIHSAVSESASDIHIEPHEKTMRIRNRVDGVLEEWMTFPKNMHLPIVTRIKILSGIDIAERRIPQDGRVRLRIDQSIVDMRVSTYPTMHGEKVVIRLLGHKNIYSLEDLGMTSRDRLTFEGIIRQPHGILLVTGPTGSGKTTTLYAALSRINSQDRNIISIEDPIENEIPGISQAQINPRAGLTFASALRSMLRQDPDVIMVGEIRDRETADISVRSAITGHLVFSTLHTNTAIGAITRMIDLGVEKFLLSSAILGVMAQRLVRRICPDCKVPADVDKAVRDKLRIPSDSTLYRGSGCKRCRMTGFLGRLGIFELVEISDELRAMVAQGIDEKELHDEATRRGMSSIRDEAIGRALEGETTIAEALRVTGEKE